MKSNTFINLGRLLLGLSFVGLLGAWWIQLTGANFFGLSQEHFFSEATVLALLGIGSLLDGMIHKQANQ